MVAKKKNTLARRIVRWRRSRSPIKIAFLLILMLISMVSSAMADGNLKNNGGTINNTGVIRIKNQAIGLPMINNGAFEFFGMNQTIPTRQFFDLNLMGGGTKTVSGGDLSVYGTMNVSNTVTVETAPGSQVHLHGNLAEQGYVRGTIDKTLNLNGVGGTSSFGNIGATISWSGVAPGTTTVTRVTGTASASGEVGFTSSQSILRYFDIAPTFGSGLNGTLVFEYRDTELNGQDENSLSLWRSPDGGASWRKQGGTADATSNTITKSGILNFSRWTASDASNPLGPNFIEGVAQNILLTSGNGQSASTNAVLSAPLVVTVRDYYGNPISGVAVTFAFGAVPDGAGGHSLGATNAVTGTNGQASTTLTLGSASGTYNVTATSPTLVGSPVAFAATATEEPPPPGPIATLLAVVGGQSQTDTVGTSLDSMFVVRVLDQNNQPFVGATVRFAIASVPTGASGHALSVDTMVTTSTGLALTKLTLGNKMGQYVVHASSGNLAGSPIAFAATAVAGRPSYLAQVAGNNQSGQIRTALPQPFVVAVTDTFSNPKPGVAVRFTLTVAPSGATGQRLSDTLVVTDTVGLARTTLTLGDSAGTYVVSAASGSLLGSPFSFVSNAVKTAPRTIALAAGNNQRGPVVSVLANPFSVVVMDSAGDAVSGVTVTFTVTETPSGASGHSLSVAQVNTDNQGRASTVLSLGNRPGIYRVQAGASGLSGSPVTFTATAEVGPAASLLFVAGDGQQGGISTTLPQPLTVRVLDGGSNPIPGIAVTFAVDSIPAAAVGALVNGAVSAQVATDASGVASVSMTLGDKVGVYRVAATSGSLAGSPIYFRLTASTAGGPVVASSMVQTSGNGQVDTVGSPVENQFIVTVLDQNNLPFAGDTVNFALTSVPPGDTSAVLSVPSIVTGANGQAATLLTLGRKFGTYTVTASSKSLPASAILFTTNAVAGKPVYLVQTAGNNQSGQVRSILPEPFVVAVTDTFGNPKQNQAVRFGIIAAPVGGSGQMLSDTLVLTTARGLAQTTLTLGDSTGRYGVAASAGNLVGSPAEFTALAVRSAPRAIALTAGNNQSGPVITPLANPFVVTVSDSLGNPVSGVTITFAITEAPVSATGQALSVGQINTDHQGRAEATLTLGNRPGVYRVQASAPGLSGSPITFMATAQVGPAASMLFVAGDGQQGEIGSTLAQPLRVQILDGGGNPVRNVGVLFAVDSIPSGATGAFVNSAVSATIQTDASGFASVAMTLGDRAGTYRVAASSSGLADSPIFFRLTATTAGGAVAIVYTAGDGQVAPILTELVLPLAVTILNASGTPVADVPVTFAIDSIPAGATSQDVLQKSVTTDADGRATTILRLGSKVGVYKVTATSSGLSPIEFRASATHGAAAAMAYVRGNGQSRVINSVLDSLLGVRITDVGGNAVRGANVLFMLDSIPTGSIGQNLTVINGTTDSFGEASARLVLGNKVGRYVVHAVSANLVGSPVRFDGTATHGPAAAILLAAGSGQQELVTSELVSSFVVLATDAGGNAVPGVGVQFAISGKPEGAVGQGLRVVDNVTGSDGTASAYLKLGNLVGTYSVQATSANLAGSPILFTATATRLISEAQQNVKELTIADLTTIIDHINQKIAPLTGPDSIRVDVNKDGRISVADVAAIRTTLLTVREDTAGGLASLGSLSIKGMPAGAKVADSTADVKGEFILSENGLRFHMTNKLPVKGLQVIMRLRNAVSITAPDVVFDRAQHHQFYINTKGLEMRLVAYNLDNIAIAPDSGAVFRLPLKLTDVEEITYGQVIVSKADNVIDADQAVKGNVEKRTVDPEIDAIPYTFVLHQNYPNPFNAQTRIEYEVADVEGRMARILIQVFSLSGEKVKTLFAGERPSGRYSAVWDGTDDRGNKMASGTYFYRLISGSYQTAKRMILLK